MLYSPLILVFIISLILLGNHWSQNKGVIYLVFIILDKALTQFALLELNATQDPNTFTWVYYLEPLIVLQGPFFLYYLKSIMKGAFVWDKYLLLFSIPTLVFLINLIPFYALPYPDQLAYFSGIALNPGLKGYLFLSLEQQYYFIAIYNTAFVFYGAWYIYKMKAKGSVYIKKKVNILISRIFIVSLLTIIPGLVVLFVLALKSEHAGMIDFLNPDAVNNNYLYFQSLVLPLSFFFVPNWLYNEKEPFSFLDNFRTTWKKVVASNSSLAEEDTFEKSSDLERIVTYIETEKPYVKVNFSLHDLSHALNIPRIRVTNCFNKDLNTSFPAYRNKLRVAHAIALLREGAHLTISIEGIAERSGFKSKSIFYAAFKEEYSMTPTEWMKKNL